MRRHRLLTKPPHGCSYLSSTSWKRWTRERSIFSYNRNALPCDVTSEGRGSVVQVECDSRCCGCASPAPMSFFDIRNFCLPVLIDGGFHQGGREYHCSRTESPQLAPRATSQLGIGDEEQSVRFRLCDTEFICQSLEILERI